MKCNTYYLLLALTVGYTRIVTGAPITETQYASTIVIDLPAPSGLSHPKVSEDIHIHLDGIFLRREKHHDGPDIMA
ncbi:hypothetical protein D9756_008567 [Leucocoprinus leucothites]|uniref:Secreted protein n=1 Tax=Leucocoprinus leucothites TaxID=201217 RepID=A0A8H5FUY0_9AGAR|nr:hypothetical protein D9756_008567 [Leucoagaricus leucothites]